MALTGIQIFKFLPAAKKTENANCKKCGCVTCMAYAMKLAKGEVSVDGCPFIDEELKQTLLLENRKPQIKIEFGHKNKVVIGEENVMFRHDKTFVNPCGFAAVLSSADENFEKKLEKIINYKIDRVGEEYKIDAINLIDESDDFLNKVQALLAQDVAVVLTIKKFSEIEGILDLIKEKQPLVYLQSQLEEDLIKLEKYCPIVVDGKDPEELSEKAEKLLKTGVKNIVLNLISTVNSDIIEHLTMIRRSAIEHKLESLGFPVMVSYKLSDNITLDTIRLSALICKYTNLICIDGFDASLMTTLITLRMNIYTDPQKPLQVEPKLYEIGECTASSNVLITTNFALTYFAVVNELEGLSDGSYLIITDSDGMSVLTAWSASKFTGEIIAKAVKNSDIENKVNHKNVIIPGLVSDLLDEIKEELPDFNIIAGPNEATDLPEFLCDL